MPPNMGLWCCCGGCEGCDTSVVPSSVTLSGPICSPGFNTIPWSNGSSSGSDFNFWRWHYQANVSGGSYTGEIIIYCAKKQTTIAQGSGCSLGLATGEMAVFTRLDFFDFDLRVDENYNSHWLEKTTGFSCDGAGKISGVHVLGSTCFFGTGADNFCFSPSPTVTVPA